LRKAAVLVPHVQEQWTYDRDPDDAHYVNLALAVGARLIVSRDKDLLDLMKESSQPGTALRAQHLEFRVLTPPQFLAIVEAQHIP
jgi:predicted nucleic acid-binding protein